MNATTTIHLHRPRISTARLVTWLPLAAWLLSAPVLADSFTEAPWGYDGAAKRCVVCHSLEKGGEFRVAPNLWDIVGDERARDREWFSYSPGLIRMGGTWTVEDLDAYLADATKFAPGSTKTIRISDPEERSEIIDLLVQLQD